MNPHAITPAETEEENAGKEPGEDVNRVSFVLFESFVVQSLWLSALRLLRIAALLNKDHRIANEP